MKSHNSCSFGSSYFYFTWCFWDSVVLFPLSVSFGFLSRSITPLYKYTTVCPFSRWQTQELFSVLAIMNKATMDTCYHVLLLLCLKICFHFTWVNHQEWHYWVKVYVTIYKGLPNLLCINLYDFIIHITHFPCNILDDRVWKCKEHSPSKTSLKDLPCAAQLWDKTLKDLQLACLVDHLKNSSSVSSMCYYALLIICWNSLLLRFLGYLFSFPSPTSSKLFSSPYISL